MQVKRKGKTLRFAINSPDFLLFVISRIKLIIHIFLQYIPEAVLSWSTTPFHASFITITPPAWSPIFHLFPQKEQKIPDFCLCL